MLLGFQATAGNRAVARSVQRLMDGMPERKEKSDADLIASGIKNRDVGDIKKVSDPGLRAAGYADKLSMIGILVDQSWVGPFDEYALETLWGSFGGNILEEAKKSPQLWKKSLEGGAELYKLPVAKELADKFIVDTRSVAGGYLDTNEKYINDELVKLGVEQPGDAAKSGGLGGQGAAPTQQEQANRQAEITAAMRLTKSVEDEKKRLGAINVGISRAYNMMADSTVYFPILFDPAQEPDPTDGNPPQDRREKAAKYWGQRGFAPDELKAWKDVKGQWDFLEAISRGLATAYPVVGIGLMGGDQKMAASAVDDPKKARDAIVAMLTSTRDSISATRPKLAGKLAFELAPIHDQLFSGSAHGSSKVDWTDPAGKALAKEVLELESNIEFWKNMGLSTLAAAAFILAEFATAGLATVALVGVGVGIGVGQAALAWDKAVTMTAASTAATSADTQLISSGQADMAVMEAALATVTVFIDGATAMKPMGKALGLADRAALKAGLGASEKVTAELATIATKDAATARPVIERAITELGVEPVVQRTGKSAAELLGIVGDSSSVAGRLKALAAVPEDIAKLAPGEFAKRAGNLSAEVLANKGTAETLAQLAVERFGPKRVVEMNGGWKTLSMALGNESTAGKSILAWRDGMMGDIEAYVKTLPGGVDAAGAAAVKRTGTQGKFTNDFDVSLLGSSASKNRNALRSFVAGRVGTTPDRLGELLLADFFTDPRRLHLYDALDPALRQEIGTRAEKVAESTIMNKTLSDAEQAGNKALAEQIRNQMKELGIPEVAFKPLSEADRGALYTKIDDLHQQLEAAITSGDKAAQKRIVEQIGDTQGLINATEGGGYFSGGATRQIVTLAEGLLKGDKAPLDAQVYTTLLDQLPKINAEASALMKSGVVATDEAVAAIKGIAKYGKRFRDLMSKLEVAVADEAAWDALASRLDTLLHQAKGETTVTLLERLESEAKAVESEVGDLLTQFQAQSQAVLLKLSRQGALGGQTVDLGAIQFLVMATAKLSRASEAVRNALASIVARLVEQAQKAAASQGATPPRTGGAQAQ